MPLDPCDVCGKQDCDAPQFCELIRQLRWVADALDEYPSEDVDV